MRKNYGNAVSVLAIVSAITAGQPALAQTVINDGDNQTVSSMVSGEIISVPNGNTSSVDAAPVVIFANDDVVLNNEGTLSTTGVTQTIQVNEATSGAIINNLVTGVITADSRAVNIAGGNVTLNNSGIILGTGNQRNGTVYADITAQNFMLNNDGTIDAGASLEGTGFSAQLSEVGNDFTIVNTGTIQGRGQASAGAATAGDGLRFERTRVNGMLDGSTTGLFTGSITNSGLISSESQQGTAAGIRFVNGVSFQGTLTNEAGGVISGAQNGLYFGNPVPAGGSDHTGGIVNNFGTISSDSRAVNIDGRGLVLNNAGTIIGTGNQRNGTVYADITAQDFTLNNDGTIDAGAGLEGAGFSAQLSEAGNDFTIVNTGTIQGRGQASAGATTAGDGLRFERTRVNGLLDGSTTGLFTGSITNSGLISSEFLQGTAAGIRFVNGVSFQGTLTNETGGVISGAQNGLYFGNPVPAGGADHTGGIVNNFGTISSGSRAVNIDGTGLVLNNAGTILGTGNQRNGTVYADATANNFVINNLADGLIDAGTGNQGSGVSLQLGAADADSRTIALTNDGIITGRGGALASGAAAGVRLFSGVSDVTVNGDITNTGTIFSETSAGILIENVNYAGIITNSGTLSGVSAFDASAALGAINFVQSGGALSGDFIGSDFTDTLTFTDAPFTLTDDILNNVDVTIDPTASVAVSGLRTVEGSLLLNGELSFLLGADSLSVDGDLTLASGSTVTVAAPADITTLALGSPVAVLSETGQFTNNGTTVNVLDDDLLVDYTVDFSSVLVTPTAADLSLLSADANISAFGGAVTQSFAGGQLDATVANALNGLDGSTAFETASLSLLPAVNEGVTREIFETQSLANAFVERRLAGKQTGAWGQAYFRTAERDADSLSATGYDADASGIALGIDRQLSETVVGGVSVNFSNIEVDDENADAGNAEIDAFQVTGYLGADKGDWFANGLVSYGSADVETSRQSLVGNVSGEFDVTGVTLQGTVGYDILDGTARIAPQVGFEYSNLSLDSYTENGGLNLTVDQEDVSFLDLKIGVEASNTYSGAEWTSKPLVRAAYVYDAIADENAFDVSFDGASAPFRLTSDDPATSRFEIGAGVELVNQNGWQVNVEYEGEFASDYSAHGGFIRAKFDF